MVWCVDVCVHKGRGELQVCRVSDKLRVGREKLLVKVLEESIEGDSDGIMRRCMCT